MVIISVFCLVLVWSLVAFAQTSPIPGAKFVVVDTVYTGGSTTYGHRGENRGFQDCIFYEPISGNLVITWYYYNGTSGYANPRRVAAATSADGGDTWTVVSDINLGLPNSTGMSGQYATAWGTSTNPILVYMNRANDDANLQYQPTLAVDLGGWGAGSYLNIYIDDKSDPDTICDYRHYDFVVAPDNPLLWLTSGWHSSSASDLPGEFYAVWRSTDGGFTWSRPKVIMSSIEADSLEPNYIWNIMSSGLLLDIGFGGKVYAAGEAQHFTDGDWWTYYSTSEDGGVTWSAPAMIPELAGLENDVNRTERNKSSIVDLAGNWHLFQVLVDTTDTTYTRFVADCIYDGTSWDLVEIARPQLTYDGLTWSSSQRWLHDPAIDADGTIYYVYMDVPDTTDDVIYKTHIKFSEDNGQTWKGPVEILDGWYTEGWGQGFSGMARVASDYLHICLGGHDNDSTSATYGTNIIKYFAVATAEIKTAVSVSDQRSVKVPQAYALFQNYPNPFNPTTTIRFDLKNQTHVTLKIFNELGQEVVTLLDKTMEPGFKGISWNASGYPSGVYFYQLNAGNYSETKKMILAR